MEVVLVGPDIIVAASPQHIAGGIDDRALARVIGADENIEAGREFEPQRRGRREAPEAARVDLGNVHKSPCELATNIT